MTAAQDQSHSHRLQLSADKMADLIGEQARSLARFPLERLDESMVTYDLLAQIVFYVAVRLVNHQPMAASTLIDQLAVEIDIMIEEWRQQLDVEEETAMKASPQ